MGPRYHYIDRCRMLLMLLGIPYHAAMMFAYDWGPPQGPPNQFCRFIAAFLTEFRMPAFFLIAGFFSAMILSRRSRADWLRQRMVRLGIPLVAATVTILPVQMLIEAITAGGTSSTIVAHWGAIMAHVSGSWISHLWFLYDLIVYSAIIAAAWPAIERVARSRVFARPVPMPFATLLLVFGIGVALPATLLGHAIDSQPTAVAVVLGRLVHNGVFVLLGIALFLRRDVLDRWLEWRWSTMIAACLILFGTAVVAASGLHERTALILGWGGAVAGAWLVLAAMKRWGDRPSPAVAFLVEASLPIYLVHHPIIRALGLVTMATSLPPEVEFLFVVVATLALSILFYLLIRPRPLLMLLFSGRRVGDPVPADPRRTARSIDPGPALR